MHEERFFRCFILICGSRSCSKEQSVVISDGIGQRKEALTASRRGTNEELGMPVHSDRDEFNPRRRNPNLHQHNSSGSHGNRSRRLHHDAQRATVGFALAGMQVRYLHNGQQRQQDKTQNHRQRQNARRCATFPAEICLESCQKSIPASRIHKIGCARIADGRVWRPILAANGLPTPDASIRLN
jgi:hypothetical protein